MYDFLANIVPKMIVEALSPSSKYINSEKDERQKRKEKHRDARRKNAIMEVSKPRPQ